MRPIAWLFCIVTHAWTVKANVEKTIFLGPKPVVLPDASPSLDDLPLDILDPARATILATQLPVQFPTAAAPRGLESWYLLRGLEDGRRYEVRICWPATQPSDFWLDTFPVTQVLDTPELISSLAHHSEQRQVLGLAKAGDAIHEIAQAQSALFLRIQAIASYYSTNRTLMEHPPPVDVDIILDPFILNVLPQSLGPTVIYITLVAVGAWFLSGYIYRWLRAVSDELASKDHKD